MTSQITLLLKRIRTGDQAAREELCARMADELHAHAERMMRWQCKDHLLQPTALVNEAVCRMLGGGVLENATSRRHLVGTAVMAMRRILVDHARKRKVRRRRSQVVSSLDQVVDAVEADHGIDLEALDAALEDLERRHPRQRQVIEYRFFGGFSISETAQLLGVSITTVERDWRLARAKLYRKLKP